MFVFFVMQVKRSNPDTSCGAAPSGAMRPVEKLINIIVFSCTRNIRRAGNVTNGLLISLNSTLVDE